MPPRCAHPGAALPSASHLLQLTHRQWHITTTQSPWLTRGRTLGAARSWCCTFLVLSFGKCIMTLSLDFRSTVFTIICFLIVPVFFVPLFSFWPSFAWFEVLKIPFQVIFWPFSCASFHYSHSCCSRNCNFNLAFSSLLRTSIIPLYAKCRHVDTLQLYSPRIPSTTLHVVAVISAYIINPRDVLIFPQIFTNFDVHYSFLKIWVSL